MSEDRVFIDLWKESVCSKLNWSVDEIRERDFEYLSDEIFKISEIDLSTATLRRIWSNQYKKTPQTSTLNALALFIGFENWIDFRQRSFERASQNLPSLKFRERPWIVVLPSILLVLLAILVVTTTSFNQPINLQNLKFEADKSVYYDVPTTAGFKYDVSGIERDVFIELSWNPYERAKLDPKGNFYTGVYYYPDYHYSKLIIDNQPVAFQPVHVITEDWHGALMRSAYEKRPIYLDESEYFRKGRIEVSTSVVSKFEIQREDTLFSELVLSNPLLDTMDINNLTFETSIKSIDYGATRQCEDVLIYLKGEKGFAMIPVTSSGCYGELNLGFSENWLSGKFHDLSNLETSLVDWQEVRIRVQNKNVEIRVAMNKPLKMSYEKDLGRLKAIKFLFTGLGAIDYVRLYNSRGEPLFIDELNRSSLGQ